MRAYHRVDPLMDERKGHYTPAQFGAFLKVQLLAGRQTERGYFRSVTALKALLPSAYARHVAFLVSEGDLVTRGDRLYLDGWTEWQEGDLTVRDRMTRLRNRDRNATVTGTVTRPSPRTRPLNPPHTPPITPGVGVGVGTGGAPVTDERWDAPEADAIVWLSQHGCYVPPVSGYYRQVVLGVENYTVEAMVGAFNRLAKAGVKKGDTKGFVFGALDVLRGKPDLKALAKEERDEETQRASDARFEATQRDLKRMRGEA